MQIKKNSFVLLIFLRLGILTPFIQTTPTYFQVDRELGAIEHDYPRYRNGLIDESKRWPDKKVHYKIDKIFGKKGEKVIESAMEGIENVSCIRFYPATPDMKIYLNITHKNNTCNSYVGYKGSEQKMLLDREKCMKKGIVMHELLHTLGFFHQHSASDRDHFVKIWLKNVKNGKWRNFMKFNGSVITSFGIPYDYDSIMHYKSTAFAKKKGLKTIIPSKSNAVIGQRDRLSKGDIAKLNIMYKCAKSNGDLKIIKILK